MRLSLEAKPEELREKSGKLVQKLSELFETIAPDFSESLEKALPRKEQQLKYPVLRELHKRTSEIYDQHVQKMLKEIDTVLDKSLEKSEQAENDFWEEIPESAGEYLWKALPHKYVRRVPYMVGGKRKYRYYYSESAAARAAKAGEVVRVGQKMVSVVAVGEDHIIIKEEGKERAISRKDWGKTLADSYGKDFYKHQEKRARQAINAVLRHVPRKTLEDLKGKTDAERLADLKKRVPEVYEKLEKSFQRAGMSAIRAKTVIADTLERKGWAPEARAVVIGSVLTESGAKRAIGHRDVLDGAENLAGGERVEPEHAQAAVTLAQADVAQVAEKAEPEIVHLQKLLQSAHTEKADPEKSAQILADALGSKAMQQLIAIAQAYPGIKDRALDLARETMLAVPSVVSRPPTTEGSETGVIVAGEGGKAVTLRAKYRLVEADEIKASHDPTKGFQRTPGYPEDVQERAYHRDVGEQNKVLTNAKKFDPRFVINTNPDSVNGPPMVTDDGIVLGGNSRTMSMQVAHEDPVKGKELRDYLEAHAHEVGLQPQDVRAMKKPILIREVEVEDRSTQNLQLLVRQMNESFTQAMDPRTAQVAKARKIDQQTLDSLTGNIRDDESLTKFLTTSRSEPFIGNLDRIGIIDKRNFNEFVKKDGRLNQDGVTMVSRLLTGKMIDDADLLSETRPARMTAIGGAVPEMIKATEFGEGYDLSEPMKVALHALNRLQDRVDAGTMKALDPKMTDRDIDEILNETFFDMFGSKHPVMEDKRAQDLLRVFIKKPGSTQFRNVFKEYARLASKNPQDQVGLIKPRTPDEVFRLSIEAATKKEAQEEKAEAQKEQPGLFGKALFWNESLDLEKALYIGPRGGKWADPQHTIPWDEKKHGRQLGLFGQAKKEKPKKEPVKKPEKKKKKEKKEDIWKSKITSKMLGQMRKDMRSLAKAYRAIKIPTSEQEKSDWLEDYKKVGTAFRTFADNLELWAHSRVLEIDEDSYEAKEVRRTANRLTQHLRDQFPTAWNYKIDDHEPSPSLMAELGEKALKRTQTEVRKFLEATERYIETRGGEISREPIVDQFRIKDINFVLHSRGMTPEGKKRIEDSLKTIRSIQEKMDSFGLSDSFRDLTVHLHNESANTLVTIVPDAPLGNLIAGWYDNRDDTLRLLPLGHEKSQETFVHELGHRVYYRMLSSSARAHWEKTLSENKIELQPEHSKQFVDKFLTKDVLHQVGEDFNVYWDKVEAKVKKDTSEMRPVWDRFLSRKPFYVFTVEGIQKHYDKIFEEGEKVDREYLSVYGATDPKEGFADAFMLYITKGPGAVPPWHREQLRAALRTTRMQLKKALYIGPKGGRWADPQHTIPYDEKKHGKPKHEPVTVKKFEVKMDAKIFGQERTETFYVKKLEGDKVRISQHEKAEHGPEMPKESVKHFMNDLQGKVDLSLSGKPDIDAVISGKAELLGKGDDGLAFKVGDKVVKVSTTVPFQPMNPGHRSPQQAKDMLRKQHEIAQEMREKGITGIQASEFVEHGDKGFQIKDYVEIPEKFTREQLDKVQDILIAMHKENYVMNDQIQPGLDKQGNPVLFDVGKVEKIKPEQKKGRWNPVDDDMEQMGNLYREHGHDFVRRDIDAAMQRWQKTENAIRKILKEPSPESLNYAQRTLEMATDGRIKQARATLEGKELSNELGAIDFAADDILFDINLAREKLGEPKKELKLRETFKSLDYDHTKPIAEKDDIAYRRIKQVLINRGWEPSDFEEGGPLYGYSVNQLLEMARERKE